MEEGILVKKSLSASLTLCRVLPLTVIQGGMSEHDAARPQCDA